MKHTWSRMGIVILVLAIMVAGYGGMCSKSKSKNTTAASSAPAATTIVITGELDGSSTQFASIPHNGFFDKFCKLFSPLEAYAGGGAVNVNKILAITYGDNGPAVTEATKNGEGFSLSLTKGNPYIIIFINGTTNVIGALKLDAATDLDALPLSNISSNIALGSVSYSGTDFRGTVSQADLLNALGITSSVASAFGTIDQAMLRWCSLDNDNNGILDFMENKQYDLTIDYGFTTNQPFGAITGSSFSNYQLTAFQGYEYYFSVSPLTDPGFAFDGDTCTATMHSPANITSTYISNANDIRHEYFRLDPDGYMFNFYTGESATTPFPPPSGDYVITLTNNSKTINKAYTFRNVKSETIDTNLYNVYVPSVKLTMASGKVSQFSYQWWKKTAGGWVQPSVEELNTVLNNANCEVGDWGVGSDSVFTDFASQSLGSAGFAVSGTVAVPAQSFTPTALRVSYTDKAGYSYGFEWRTIP